MRLRALGVIRDAVLELGPGLTVVTGETGAGKTMVVTGLGLLLGGRADAAAVRTGQSAALVEGRVLIDPDGDVARRVIEAGAELDDAGATPGTVELIISRTVSAEGRSRAHVGGRAAPVSLLGELADDLVAVHGQSDQIRLRSTARQRQALDRFAGAEGAEALAVYQENWRRLRAVRVELDELTTRARERAQEAELLRLGLAEVERIDPTPGEDVDLRQEADRLTHAEELRTAAATAQEALTGRDDAIRAPDDALAAVTAARQALDHARAHDPRLGTLADRLAEVAVLIADVAADCASYEQEVDADPARLAAVQDRRAELAGLLRGYGESVDAVLDWARSAGLRLLELDGDTDRVTALREEHDRLRDHRGSLAGRLSAVRARAAADLGAAVTAELAELSMPDARLVVDVRHREDAVDGLPVPVDGQVRLLAAGPDGVDDVELQLVPHAGAPARPIAKGASGGELSRVMLGLEVVLAAADPVPTFVFDEVDAGVGGTAALGIGRRLARLARSAQVIVVTHLS